MEKEQIESKSKEVAEYFKKYWTSYADPAFDRTFSLRNWATIMAALFLHFNKNKNNIKNNNENSKKNTNKKIDNDIKNINKNENSNYENELKKIFKNKKILHIG